MLKHRLTPLISTKPVVNVETNVDHNFSHRTAVMYVKAKRPGLNVKNTK